MREITDAERFAWQHRAVSVLGKLIDRAPREGLKPITWTVNAAGPTLYALVISREDYDGWRALLGAPDHEQTAPTGSGKRVAATWERYNGCRVTLVLTGFGDEEQADG